MVKNRVWVNRSLRVVLSFVLMTCVSLLGTGCATLQCRQPGLGDSPDSMCGFQKPEGINKAELYTGLALIAAGGATAGIGGWKLAAAGDRRDAAAKAIDPKERDVRTEQADDLEEVATYAIPLGAAVFSAGVTLFVLALVGEDQPKADRSAGALNVTPWVATDSAGLSAYWSF